ncbi:hypothetical protein UNSW1_1487 [Campylobacter concisus UNSW1]|nr:hypothetical protein UNSW1_1487 [Campylobacter concisus UNSW1]
MKKKHFCCQNFGTLGVNLSEQIALVKVGRASKSPCQSYVN